MKRYCKGTEIFNTCLGHLSLITKNVDLRFLDFCKLCGLRDSNRDSEPSK